MGKPVEKVTIVGGRTAGWLTAAPLLTFGRKAVAGNKPLQISLIDSPDISTVGVGEATLPGMVRTPRNTGISEHAFFRRCNASFKLGVMFSHWNVTPGGPRSSL